MIVAGHKTNNHFAPVRVLAVGDFLAAHPGWVVELHLNRPGEGGYYIPGSTEIVNGMLFWTPDRTDTEHEGIGQLQVFARGPVDEFGALCDKTDVRIKSSLTDPVEITEPMVPYLEAVLDEAAKIRATAQDVHADREAADQSANQAQSALRELEQKIASGDFHGADGESAYITATRVANGVMIRTEDKEGQTQVLLNDGPQGSDADVTAENITTALGYTPADEKKVSDLKSQISKLNDDVDETKSDIGELKGDLAQKADASTVDELASDLAEKQDTLVSGQNIKTINGESILGTGNIAMQGGAEKEWVLVATANDSTNRLTGMDLSEYKEIGYSYTLMGNTNFVTKHYVGRTGLFDLNIKQGKVYQGKMCFSKSFDGRFVSTINYATETDMSTGAVETIFTPGAFVGTNGLSFISTLYFTYGSYFDMYSIQVYAR